MSRATSAGSRVSSIAITERQWQAMLAEPLLGAPYYGTDRRNGDRVAYRRVGRLLIRMGLLGRRTTRFLVRTRDVSAQGVSFFHSQAVPVGTRCELALMTIDQQVRRCHGWIANCRARDEGVWEVGVRLQDMLEGHDFIPQRK